MRTLTFLLCLAMAVPALAADEPEKPSAEKEREARFAALAAEAEPYKTFGDQIIEMLAEGDAAAVKKRMSPSAVKRNGEEKLGQFVDGELIPYFAKYDKLDPEMMVVSRTNDADGNKGFAIQYVFIEKDGTTRRPLVMFVLRENDEYVVANVMPGRSIEEASRTRPKPQ